MIFRYPDKPIETTPEGVAQLDESKYVAQWKYDGWSTVIPYEHGAQFLSRMGQSILTIPGAKFPLSLAKAFEEYCVKIGLPQGTILVTEFVGPRGKHPPGIYIVDIQAWGGDWLTNEPFWKRWALCRQIAMASVSNMELAIDTAFQPIDSEFPSGIYLANTIEKGFVHEFNRLKQQWENNGRGMDLCEGLVLKHREGTLYLDRKASKKSPYLLKVKYRDIQNRRF